MNAKNSILLKDYYNLLFEYVSKLEDWETTGEIAKKFNSTLKFRFASLHTIRRYLEVMHSKGLIDCRVISGGKVWRGLKKI